MMELDARRDLGTGDKDTININKAVKRNKSITNTSQTNKNI